MLSIYEKFIFVLVFILSMYMGFRSFSTMFKVINKGQGKLYFDNMAKRISKSLSAFLLQTTVLTSRPLISIIHSVVAWAFILYMIVNLGDILRGFIPEFHFLGDGMIGRLYRLFVDIFTVMALIGVVILLVRRFIFSSPTLEINENVFLLPSVRKGMKRDSLIVGLFILGHVGFRFLGESFSLAVDGPDAWQPLASSLAFVWQDLNYDLLIYFVHASWWLAIGLILAFIPYFPGSKHAHLFMGPLNYFTQPHRSSPGTLNRIDFEDENAEQFGVSKIVHLEKTQLFDAYACIMCNRCQDVCPATLTGKA